VVLKHLRMYVSKFVENLIFKMCPLFPKCPRFLVEISENIKGSPYNYYGSPGLHSFSTSVLDGGEWST
jgi:hypothetical protein